jgi:hypothetical protein
MFSGRYTYYDRLNHRLLFRVNSDRLDELFKTSFPSESRNPAMPRLSESPSESRKAAMPRPESGHAMSGKRSCQGRKPAVDYITAETTAQITPENTATTLVANAQAKGTPPSKKAVVAVPCLEAGSAEESRRIDELMESLAPGFKLNGRHFKLNGHQMNEVRACAKHNGSRYVEEKAELTRAEAKKNPAKFFMDALAEDWQPPAKIDKKRKPSHSPPSPAEPAPEPMTPEQKQACDAARRALLDSLRNPSKSPEAQAKTSAAEARCDRMKRRWDEASLEERNRWIAQGDPIIRKYFRAEGPLPMRSLWSAIIPEADGEAEQPTQEAAA